MFFFKIEFDSDIDVNAVMDKKGKIFFKGLDVLTALGYKKPAEAIRNHVPRAISLDVLLNRNGNSVDARVIPFPTNSKLLSREQVFRLLSKLKRPRAGFRAWFVRVFRRKLKCHEDLAFLRRVNHDVHCVLPRFSVRPDGDVFLNRLKFELSEPESEDAEVDRKPDDLEVVKTSIGVNTDVTCPRIVEYGGPEVRIENELEGIEVKDFDVDEIPQKLFYKTKNSIFQFVRL